MTRTAWILAAVTTLLVSPATADHQPGEHAVHCIATVPTESEWAWDTYKFVNRCSNAVQIAWCFVDFFLEFDSCGNGGPSGDDYYMWFKRIDGHGEIPTADSGKAPIESFRLAACKSGVQHTGIDFDALDEKPTVYCH